MKDQIFDRDLSSYGPLYKRDKLLGKIWAYSELGMHKDAVSECKGLIKAYPDDPVLAMELGICYQRVGKIEKAIGCYKRAIKIFPWYSAAYVNLGYIFEKHKKRNDMAIVCYEKALELDPCDEWAINNIGAILTKKGRWKEGLFYYEKAYKVCRQKYGFACSHIVHNLAWALYRCKRYARSWLIYSYLAYECLGNADILSDFGCVNYKMGKHGEALDFFERALSVDPNNKQYQRLYRVVKK